MSYTPAFALCKNKDADQLHANLAADQCLCFCYIDSTILLLPKSERRMCIKPSLGSQKLEIT